VCTPDVLCVFLADCGCYRYTGAIILAIVYGYDVKDSSDTFVTVAEHYNRLVARCLLPGELVVNTFPFRTSLRTSLTLAADILQSVGCPLGY